MAATTVDRNTLARKLTRQIVMTLKANEDIPAGAMVCADANGLAVNASEAANLVAVGRAQHRATYSAGDRKITVMIGVFLWANNGNVTQASVGRTVVIVDNQTVGLAADTTIDIVAGVCEELDAAGVWVAMSGPALV